jgi:hypothetical protein
MVFDCPFLTSRDFRSWSVIVYYHVREVKPFENVFDSLRGFGGDTASLYHSPIGLSSTIPDVAISK